MVYNFINKLAGGTIDEDVHQRFIRYGPGKFIKEAFTIKLMAKSVQVQCGVEYCQVIFSILSDQLDEDVDVSGVVVSKKDLRSDFEELGIEPVKITGKKYTIKENMDPKRFKTFVERFRANYLLLAIKGKNFNLRSKKSVPKPGKPVEKFYTLKMPTDRMDLLKEEFLFDVDVGSFKLATINHTYLVEDIVVPEEFKDDPALARLKAIRKGKIMRQVDVDGEVSEKEYNLEA